MGSEAVDTYENITVRICTANAAFDDYPATELGRIFRKLAKQFEEDGGPESGAAILDANGNQVGYILIESGVERG